MRHFLLATCLIAVTSAHTSGAEILHYIDKYQGVAVVNSQVACLEKYQPLIEYFTSLSYLKPNHRINSDFMRALIVAESACDPQARSKQDARGLTQILFSTGKEAATILAAANYPYSLCEQ
jgi:soluble lytic murein transglycosylase-like protein